LKTFSYRGGTGSVTFTKNQAGVIRVELGVASHNGQSVCELIGDLIQDKTDPTRATVKEETCVGTFELVGDREVNLSTSDGCDAYCGNSLAMDGRYGIMPEECRGDQFSAARQRATALLKEKRFNDAYLAFYHLFEGCGDFLRPVDYWWLRSDLALAALRTERMAECRNLVEPALEMEDLPKSLAKAIKFNFGKCSGAAEEKLRSSVPTQESFCSGLGTLAGEALQVTSTWCDSQPRADDVSVMFLNDSQLTQKPKIRVAGKTEENSSVRVEVDPGAIHTSDKPAVAEAFKNGPPQYMTIVSGKPGFTAKTLQKAFAEDAELPVFFKDRRTDPKNFFLTGVVVTRGNRPVAAYAKFYCKCRSASERMLQVKWPELDCKTLDIDYQCSRTYLRDEKGWFLFREMTPM
jgi:hypothetical protein